MISRLLLLVGGVLLTGFTELPTQPKPFDPAEAAKQGRELAQEILAQKPTENFTNSGVLKIRDGQGKQTELDVSFSILLTPTNWLSSYYYDTSLRSETVVEFETLDFTIIHEAGGSNVFLLQEGGGYGTKHGSNHCHFEDPHRIAMSEMIRPFARSDFWLCDLGLEFFHWPEQKILKTELRKTRSCKVLESVNPQPGTNCYSRVVSWIDTESLGIIHADAYDAAGRWLKEFDPKTVKEVNGQPQLVKMEMYNRQTRSRSQIEFNVDVK